MIKVTECSFEAGCTDKPVYICISCENSFHCISHSQIHAKLPGIHIKRLVNANSPEDIKKSFDFLSIIQNSAENKHESMINQLTDACQFLTDSALNRITCFEKFKSRLSQAQEYVKNFYTGSFGAYDEELNAFLLEIMQKGEDIVENADVFKDFDKKFRNCKLSNDDDEKTKIIGELKRKHLEFNQEIEILSMKLKEKTSEFEDIKSKFDQEKIKSDEKAKAQEEKILELTESIKHCLSVNSGLSEKILENETKYFILQKIHSETQEKTQTLQEDLDSKSQKIAQLTLTVETLSQKIKNSEAKTSEMDKKNHELGISLITITLQTKNFKTNIENMRKNLEEKDKELANQNERHKFMLENAINEQKHYFNEIKAEKMSLEQEILELKANVLFLEKSLAKEKENSQKLSEISFSSSSSLVKNYEELQKDIEELSEKNERYKNEIEMLLKCKEELRNKHEESKNAYKSLLESKKEEINVIQNRVQELETLVNKLKISQDDVLKKIESLVETNAILEASLKKEKEDIKKLKVNLEEVIIENQNYLELYCKLDNDLEVYKAYFNKQNEQINNMNDLLQKTESEKVKAYKILQENIKIAQYESQRLSKILDEHSHLNSEYNTLYTIKEQNENLLTKLKAENKILSNTIYNCVLRILNKNSILIRDDDSCLTLYDAKKSTYIRNSIFEVNYISHIELDTVYYAQFTDVGICIIDKQTLQIKFSYELIENIFNNFSVSFNNKFIALNNNDLFIILEVTNQDINPKIVIEEKDIKKIMFTKNEQFCVTFGNKICVWGTESGQLICKFKERDSNLLENVFPKPK